MPQHQCLHLRHGQAPGAGLARKGEGFLGIWCEGDGQKRIAGLQDGTLAKLWDKWFLQPIPPKGVKIGLALSESTKAAWANPNDKPMEDYAKK